MNFASNTALGVQKRELLMNNVSKEGIPFFIQHRQRRSSLLCFYVPTCPASPFAFRREQLTEKVGKFFYSVLLSAPRWSSFPLNQCTLLQFICFAILAKHALSSTNMSGQAVTLNVWP